MNKKGIFSTITGFFLVVIVVFGLLGLLGFYSGLVQIDSLTREDFRSYDVAKQFKDNLFICHGQNFLRGARLDEQDMSGPCNIPSQIQGFRVVSLNESCGDSWEFGELDSADFQIIPYRVNVLQSDGVRNCVSNLLIHV